MSLVANTSIPTFFGPSIIFAQMLSLLHSVTSIVNCCQRHLPIISFRSAAKAETHEEQRNIAAQTRKILLTNAPPIEEAEPRAWGGRIKACSRLTNILDIFEHGRPLSRSSDRNGVPRTYQVGRCYPPTGGLGRSSVHVRRTPKADVNSRLARAVANDACDSSSQFREQQQPPPTPGFSVNERTQEVPRGLMYLIRNQNLAHTSVYESGGQEFESLRARHFGIRY